MAQNITLLGANYPDVPSVTLPKTGGGTASFVDTTSATATSSDILDGKVAFNASGAVTGTFKVEPSKTVTVTESGTVIVPTVGEVDVPFVIPNSASLSTTINNIPNSWNGSSFTQVSRTSVDNYQLPQTQTTSNSFELTTGKTYHITGSGTLVALTTSQGFSSILGYCEFDETFVYDGTAHSLGNPFSDISSNKVTRIDVGGTRNVCVYWSSYSASYYDRRFVPYHVDSYTSEGATYQLSDPMTISEVAEVEYDAMSEVVVNIEGGGTGGNVTQDAQGYVVLDDDGGGGDSVFIITCNDYDPYDTETKTVDKTHAEIIDAINSGQSILVRFVTTESMGGTVMLKTVDYPITYTEVMTGEGFYSYLMTGLRGYNNGYGASNIYVINAYVYSDNIDVATEYEIPFNVDVINV